MQLPSYVKFLCVVAFLYMVCCVMFNPESLATGSPILVKTIKPLDNPHICNQDQTPIVTYNDKGKAIDIRCENIKLEFPRVAFHE